MGLSRFAKVVKRCEEEVVEKGESVEREERDEEREEGGVIEYEEGRGGEGIGDGESEGRGGEDGEEEGEEERKRDGDKEIF